MEDLKDYGLAIEVEKIAKAIDEDDKDDGLRLCCECGEEITKEQYDKNDEMCRDCEWNYGGGR